MSNFSKKVFFALISLSFLLNQNAVAHQSNSGCEHFAVPANTANLVVMEKCPHNNLSVPANAANLIILKKKPAQNLPHSSKTPEETLQENPQKKTFWQKSGGKIKSFGQKFLRGLKTTVRVIEMIVIVPIILMLPISLKDADSIFNFIFN